MGSEKLVTDLQPDVEILISSIGGDLHIEGSIEAGMKVRGDNPRLAVDDDGHRVSLSCTGDCRLKVPVGARLTVDSIGGDAKIIGIDGDVKIANVGGDLVLRHTGPVTLDQVGASLETKRINGPVQVGHIGGDAKFRSINGALTVNLVGADALVKDVTGSCKIDSVGGDLVLSIAFDPASRYEFTVGADVLGRVPAGSNVRFVVPSDTETSIQIAGVRPQTDGDLDIYIIGDGSATVEFKEVGGDLRLVDAGIGEGFDPVFDTAVPDDLEEVINARISEQIDAIQDRLHRETDRIRKQAERTAERVKQQAAAHSRAWGFQWSPSEKGKRGGFGFDMGEKEKRDTPSEPVSDKERLAILQMVEEKKISVEEAARLLSALEGTD